ncbi:unnamed protein product [Enterobius vermicularis]|uniref:Prothymosin alpha-like n=1 Tax=Enterobius vermicularis TaxID=51028 RepID=A0A0N4UZE6_ENTVE|nr:unnamed protein product [Enterobius vermicularis]
MWFSCASLSVCCSHHTNRLKYTCCRFGRFAFVRCYLVMAAAAAVCSVSLLDSREVNYNEWRETVSTRPSHDIWCVFSLDNFHSSFIIEVYVCFILITVANMSAVEERVAEKRHLDDKDVENGVAAKEAKLENGSAVHAEKDSTKISSLKEKKVEENKKDEENGEDAEGEDGNEESSGDEGDSVGDEEEGGSEDEEASVGSEEGSTDAEGGDPEEDDGEDGEGEEGESEE